MNAVNDNPTIRYYSLDSYYKEKYGCKVAKISLNAGFTCPNIDGTCGTGGCIYCSPTGSGEFGGNKEEPLMNQFQKVKQLMQGKWPNAKYIGYFQAHSNTYAPLSILKEKYEPILALENVVGLNIATRADAIREEVLVYLEELATRTDLTIELGLQTIHEQTSKLINRCHSLECFDQMVQELNRRNIKVVVHVINGLPNETKEMMIDTIKHLNKLPIHGIKFHMLYIDQFTQLFTLWKENPFHLLTEEEYIDILITQLEYLRPNIVIHRLMSGPDLNTLVAPLWLSKRLRLLNHFNQELKRRQTYQGKYNEEKTD